MGKEIIINARKDQTRIAIVENGDLAEMYFEDPDNERTLGDIYLGRVRRIMPSIQAAFIDIGQASDAFLHFSDIADNVGDMIRLLDMAEADVGKLEISSPVRRRRPRGPAGTQVSMDDDEDHAEEEARQGKSGRQQRGGSNGNGQSGGGSRSSGGDSGSTFRPEDLKKDQKILVKIVKEPISSKGSRVSTDISLAGRFLVLVPLADYVAVSKKIVSYKERRRLRALAKSLLPKGFGLIVRTVAEDKNAKALDTDLRLLVEKWRRIEKRLNEVKNPPAVLHQDVNMVSSVIRDLFSDDYERILIDDQRVFRNVKGYIQAVAPQMAPAVKMHSDRQPIFQAAGIEKAVRQAFESRVDLPSGGYLIIEHTEAMHVIDVNSGRAGRGLSQEQNSLKVNLESARMIAQQLRLRDLGGIIVVDFIDLRDDKNRKKVYDELKKYFRKDRAVTKILPMSDFGLMQITRQRLRPSITTVKKTEEDRAKSSTPAIAESAAPATPRMTPEEWREKLERWVVRYHEKGKRKPLTLRVHPFAKSYLGRGVAKATLKWFWKYRIRVGVETDAEQNPLSFRFFDAESGNELTRRRRSGRRRGKKRSRDGSTAANKSQSGSANKSQSSSASDSGKRADSRGENRSRGRSGSKSDSRSGGRSGNRSDNRSGRRSGKRSSDADGRSTGSASSKPSRDNSGGRSPGRDSGRDSSRDSSRDSGRDSGNTSSNTSSNASGNTSGNTSGNASGRGSGSATARTPGNAGRSADSSSGRSSGRNAGNNAGRGSDRSADSNATRDAGRTSDSNATRDAARSADSNSGGSGSTGGNPGSDSNRKIESNSPSGGGSQRRSSRSGDANGGAEKSSGQSRADAPETAAPPRDTRKPASDTPTKPATADNGTPRPEPAAAIKTTFSSHHRPEPEQKQDQ